MPSDDPRFRGLIDEVHAFATALSAQQVAALMHPPEERLRIVYSSSEFFFLADPDATLARVRQAGFDIIWQYFVGHDIDIVCQRRQHSESLTHARKIPPNSMSRRATYAERNAPTTPFECWPECFASFRNESTDRS